VAASWTAAAEAVAAGRLTLVLLQHHCHVSERRASYPAQYQTQRSAVCCHDLHLTLRTRCRSVSFGALLLVRDVFPLTLAQPASGQPLGLESP